MPHSSTAFDNSHVGVYGTADLFNLFGGYKCGVRPFTIEALPRCRLGKDIDWNYFATKVGLNFNFNVTEHLTTAVKPSIVWNMNGNSRVWVPAYKRLPATSNCVIGDGFCVRLPTTRHRSTSLTAVGLPPRRRRHFRGQRRRMAPALALSSRLAEPQARGGERK